MRDAITSIPTSIRNHVVETLRKENRETKFRMFNIYKVFERESYLVSSNTYMEDESL